MKFLPLFLLFMTTNVFTQTIDCQELKKIKLAQKTKLNIRHSIIFSGAYSDDKTIYETDTFMRTRIIKKSHFKKGPKAGKNEETETLIIDKIRYTKSTSKDIWEFIEKPPSDTAIQKQFEGMKPRYDNCHKVSSETIDGKVYDIIETTLFMKVGLDSVQTMRIWVNFQDSSTKKTEMTMQLSDGKTSKGVTEYGVEMKPIEKPKNTIPQADNIRLNSNRAVPQYKDYTLYSYIKSHLVYPKIARDAKIEGMVIVEFTVEIDGSICEINVTTGLGYDCDEAAIEAVKKTSGNWLPALKLGKPIRAKYKMPIQFKL